MQLHVEEVISDWLSGQSAFQIGFKSGRSAPGSAWIHAVLTLVRSRYWFPKFVRIHGCTLQKGTGKSSEKLMKLTQISAIRLF